MPGIVLPAHVAENLEAEESSAEVIFAYVRYWNFLLREIDPRLTLVMARERLPETSRLVAGRWHVRVRAGPPFADLYMPITTPDGGYREPDSGVLEELKRRGGDFTPDDLIERRQARERARERERGLRREQYRDEIAADIKTLRRMEMGGTKRRKQ